MPDVDERLITGETIVRTTSKHWIAPLGDSKWAILMIVGALVAAWLQGDSTTGVTGFFNRGLELVRLGLFLGAIAWIVYNIVAWRTAEYHVTNRRVFGTDGLIRRRQTDTLLTSIADVKTTMPWLGRMLGFGHIRIVSASGEAGSDSFTNVRDIEPFKREILEQKAGVGPMGEGAAADVQRPPAPLPSGSAPPAQSATDITATLGELARLRDAGAITAEEYESKKVELLARL
jgi:Bacterial PH domain/Short C-terminal domain